MVGEIELRKLGHDPTEVLTRTVQPVLWLVIFGQAFARLHAAPTGQIPYRDFLTPGILAQSVMFIAIFYGLTLIWEKDQGVLQKFLVLPVPRAAFPAGKAVGACVRAFAQGVVVLLLAYTIGVHLRFSLVGTVYVFLAVILGAAFFATLSMMIAVLVKSRERFMGIGQVITMPLFFASNAIYPIRIMPGWLQWLARANPLSYMVDLLRGSLITGRVADAPLDLTVLVMALIVVQVVVARTYARVVT